jgi:hypothetical protein
LIPIPILELPENPTKELREMLSNENEPGRHDDPLCPGYREGNSKGNRRKEIQLNENQNLSNTKSGLSRQQKTTAYM